MYGSYSEICAIDLAGKIPSAGFAILADAVVQQPRCASGPI
jgi:hypothetical protein